MTMTCGPFAVLTRPAGRNDALAARLRAQGWDVLDLPALEIEALPADAATLPRPGDHDLVVFVSGTAVRCYLRQLRDVAGMQQWPAGVTAACVGPATAAALRDSSFWHDGAQLLHPGPGAPAYDSEALWQLMQARGFMPRRVLLVRGTTGRDWLGQTLASQGADVRAHAAYRRVPAQWPATALPILMSCRDEGRPAHWLLTSGEGIQAVHGQIRRTGLESWWRRCRFVVTHPRLVQHLEAFAPDAVARGMVKICLPEDEAIEQALRA